MSRTRRNKRPKMRLGELESHVDDSGKVRDGTPQYVSVYCQHHNWCPYCKGNRTHSNKRREPIEESLQYEAMKRLHK